jgi:subfamily B ATP-binding cassette protein MsbA
MGSRVVSYKQLAEPRLRRALQYLKYCKGWMLLALFSGALMICLQLCLPWVVKVLFDTLTGNRQMSLVRLVLILATVGIGAGFCENVKNYALAQAAERILARVREHLYSKLRTFPMAYFGHEQTGRIMSVLTSDAPTLTKLFNPVLGDAFVSVLQLLSAIAILSLVSPWLTLLAFFICGLYLLVPFFTARPLRRLNQEKQRLTAELSADLQESVSGTREIKAFSREEWDLERLGRSFRAFLPLQNKITVLQVGISSNLLIYWLVASFLYWFGGQRVLAHEISFGSLFSTIWYFAFLDMPMRQFVGLNDQLQSALAAGDRVFDLLDLQDTALEQTGAEELPQLAGHVTFENVDFAYQPGIPVLKRVSLSVSPGERVAVVGASGAGKSTLLSLILRLHSVTSGRILVDGHDISQVDLRSLRTQIGVVFQDTFLFNTSIRENIRFAKLDATDEEVVAAAKAADAHSFVLELPSGYDTKVGERGAALSGGQRQRIAIARAMLLDPRILILDEATSSLDSQAERTVAEALERLMRGRTTIIASHRLAAIAKGDRIIVLDEGQVVASGDHYQLMAQCDWYRESFARTSPPQDQLTTKAGLEL